MADHMMDSTVQRDACDQGATENTRACEFCGERYAELACEDYQGGGMDIGSHCTAVGIADLDDDSYRLSPLLTKEETRACGEFLAGLIPGLLVDLATEPIWDRLMTFFGRLGPTRSRARGVRRRYHGSVNGSFAFGVDDRVIGVLCVQCLAACAEIGHIVRLHDTEQDTQLASFKAVWLPTDEASSPADRCHLCGEAYAVPGSQPSRRDSGGWEPHDWELLLRHAPTGSPPLILTRLSEEEAQQVATFLVRLLPHAGFVARRSDAGPDRAFGTPTRTSAGIRCRYHLRYGDAFVCGEEDRTRVVLQLKVLGGVAPGPSWSVEDTTTGEAIGNAGGQDTGTRSEGNDENGGAK